MKKALFLIAAAAVLGAGNVGAQLIDGSSEAVVQWEKPVEQPIETQKPVENKAVQNEEDEVAATEEEIRELLEIKDQPSPTIEPSRKVYLKSDGKREVKETVKAQKEEKERKRMVEAVSRIERVQKRRQALLEGKSREEAIRESEKVERPNVNVKNDLELSEYLYEKVGLNDKD